MFFPWGNESMNFLFLEIILVIQRGNCVWCRLEFQRQANMKLNYTSQRRGRRDLGSARRELDKRKKEREQKTERDIEEE